MITLERVSHSNKQTEDFVDVYFAFFDNQQN